MMLVLGTKGSGAHILRAFEARGAEMILEAEVEVLRARLAEHVGSAIRAVLHHLLDGLAAPTCARRTAGTPQPRRA